MATAIPKRCQYSLKPSAPKGKRTRRVLPSLGNNPSSGYTLGTDTATFYVPGGTPNTVMDGQSAYLRYTLQVTTAAAGGDVAADAQKVMLDYTGASIIRRLDCYGAGNNLVESVDRYNTLANIIYDCQESYQDMVGQSTMLGSTDGTIQGSTFTTVESLSRTGYLMSCPSTLTSSGSINTQYFSFAVPIISSIFALSESHFPTYAVNDDLRLDFVFDTQINAFYIPTVTNSTVTVTVLSPELVVDFIELEPSVIQAMSSAYSGGDIVLHANTYHNYETTITSATQGTFNTILPSKVMSAKALFTSFRNLATTGVQAGFTQSSRLNPFLGALSSWNINAGGVRIPQRPIQSYKANDVSEFFAELQKANHALFDLSMNGQLARDCYTSATAPAVGDLPVARGFLAGINLDMLKGNSDQILSGLDLSKVTTYLEANFATAISGLVTANSFVLHDVLIVIDSLGNVTSKY